MSFTRSAFWIAAVVASIAAFALPAGADDAAPTPAWTAFVAIAAGADDAVETIATHQTVGSASSERTYRISYRKPSDARCEVLAGRGAGGVAVWNGGSNVHVHSAEAPATIVLTLKRDNPLVTDLVGNPCGAAALPLLAQRWQTDGTVTEAPGPTIDGVDTDLVTFVPSATVAATVTKEELYLSKATHLPVASKGYRGDTLVESSTYRDIAFNTGLRAGLFRL